MLTTSEWTENRQIQKPLPKTVHNLRVAILRSIQENLYKESPEDWDAHPKEETTTTGTSGSGNEVGEVRP